MSKKMFSVLMALPLLANAQNVGIGTTTPNAPLQFSQNFDQNRKIVLYEDANNDHQFNGFGINPGSIRYQIASTGSSHIFYAGTSDAGSAELIRIKGNGNVGLGTATPNAPLQFSQNSEQNRKIVMFENANNDHQYYGFGINPNIMRYQVFNSFASHVFYAGTSDSTSAEIMRIKGNGNVGIGNTTPNAPLQFAQIFEQNRKIVLYENANNDHQFNGFGLNTNVLRYQVGNTLASHVFYAGTGVSSSAELMRIKGNGNVGLGNNNPNAPLQFAQIFEQNRKIVLYENANNDHQFNGFGLNTNILRYQVGNTLASHVFYAGTGASSSTELMRIQGDGNVGIGTINPLNKLVVIGNIRLTNTADGSSGTIGIGVAPAPNAKININSNMQYGLNIDGSSTAGGSLVRVNGTSVGNVVFFNGSSATEHILSVAGTATTGNVLRVGGTAGNVLRVGGTASNYNLYVDGSAAKTDGYPLWSIPSDARLKENIIPYREGLAELLKINPVKYHYTKASGLNNDHENIGILAQELKEVAPNMVFKKKGEQTNEELYHVNLSPMLFMYVNAIKELDAKNKAQEIRISKLEALVQEMDARYRR